VATSERGWRECSPLARELEVSERPSGRVAIWAETNRRGREKIDQVNESTAIVGGGLRAGLCASGGQLCAPVALEWHWAEQFWAIVRQRQWFVCKAYAKCTADTHWERRAAQRSAKERKARQSSANLRSAALLQTVYCRLCVLQLALQLHFSALLSVKF